MKHRLEKCENLDIKQAEITHIEFNEDNSVKSVITNIGVSHIEQLGSREGILKAKLEICDGMDKDGVLVLNGDDKFLSKAQIANPLNVKYFAIENKEEILLHGGGYGHGAGMSQNGANKMAEKDYHYEDILYYSYWLI